MSSVNAPTNTKVKEQDINSKLQLYGIYEGTSYLPRPPTSLAAPLLAQSLNHNC